jgi:Alkylmercury lyase
MTPEARAVRAEIFETFAREGRPPSPAELREKLGFDPAAALRELHDLHAIVLTEAGDGVRLAHPFSAWPMGFVLRQGDRFWWGGCAWDSFGIVAALRERLEILTVCPSCGRELRYAASHTEPPADAEEYVVRLPRPAAEWWEDVVATCTDIRTFCSREHVGEWRERTGAPEGYVTDLATLWKLAQPWYGDRLDPDWEPHTREHNQSVLESCGLTGPFWRLPGSAEGPS